MTTELLVQVDWNEWKRQAEARAHQHPSEEERLALLLLNLRRHTKKAERKIVRMALRDIEQAIIGCEQDIDYL